MVSSKLARTLAVALVLSALSSARLGAQSDINSIAQRVAEQPITPGDKIDLKFLRDVELNATLTVNERGAAVFPKLGQIEISHIKIGALRDTLSKRYSEYLRGAEIEVSVLRRVVVNGEVKMPEVYYLDATSTVRDAVARAGGTIETANKGKVTIVRGSQRIRVRRWETNQGPESDLRSGDQVIVGRQSWLKLNALPVISTSVIVIGLIRSIRQ
jgi:protein involved in polysaccharide export with SLBB domain